MIITVADADKEAWIYEAISDERGEQVAKWGEQNHTPEKWLAILGEEFGEACKAWLENDRELYGQELIQVAAVAIAAIGSMQRQHEVKSTGG